jgi:hypothetical protein
MNNDEFAEFKSKCVFNWDKVKLDFCDKRLYQCEQKWCPRLKDDRRAENSQRD